jgi:UDP-galactopyranose mutase
MQSSLMGGCALVIPLNSEVKAPERPAQNRYYNMDQAAAAALKTAAEIVGG